MNLTEEAGTGNPRRASETATRSKVTADTFGIAWLPTGVLRGAAIGLADVSGG